MDVSLFNATVKCHSHLFVRGPGDNVTKTPFLYFSLSPSILLAGNCIPATNIILSGLMLF